MICCAVQGKTPPKMLSNKVHNTTLFFISAVFI